MPTRFPFLARAGVVGLTGRPRSAGWTRPRRPLTGRFARTTAVAGLLLVAGVATATTASGHSELERSNPAAGGQVAVLPDRITLTFNQDVLGLGSVVEVTGPDGNIADGKPRVANNRLQQALQPGAVGGAYSVIWRVTSADGHPISGRFTFTAAAGSRTTPAETATADPGTATADPGTATADPGTAGTATTAPAAAAATDPAAPDPAAGGSGSVWLLLGLGALVVASGVILAARRAGSGAADPEA